MSDPPSIDKSLLTEAEFKRLGVDCKVEEISALIKKKTKTDEDQEVLQFFWDRSLSAGARTYLKAIAKGISYDFEKELDVKAFSKGRACED